MNDLLIGIGSLLVFCLVIVATWAVTELRDRKALAAFYRDRTVALRAENTRLRESYETRIAAYRLELGALDEFRDRSIAAAELTHLLNTHTRPVPYDQDATATPTDNVGKVLSYYR